MTPPLVVDDVVFFAAHDRYIYSLDRASGERRWAKQLPKYAQATPALIDDVLYIAAGDRNVYALDPATGEPPVWWFESPEFMDDTEDAPWHPWDKPFFYFKVQVDYQGLEAETPKDCEGQRGETLQRVRVVFERMGHLIRQAKAITAITQPTDPQGSISILDFSDQTHGFQLVNGALYYGTADPADQLLAEGFQELRFEGFDANGPVSPSSPGDIDAVRVEATADVPGTGETVRLATFVRLRRQVVAAQVRNVTCYATQYQTTLGSGLQNASRGLYMPDGKYARLRAGAGGRYYGFSQSKYSGPIQLLHDERLVALEVGGVCQGFAVG